MFPVPAECRYLTVQSKDAVLQQTKCNEQGSKVRLVVGNIETCVCVRVCMRACVWMHIDMWI